MRPPIKQYSERGKISELGKKHEEEVPLTSWEKRLAKLINYAMTYRDSGLMRALGFIYTTVNGIAELPVAIVRLREQVKSIYAQSKTIAKQKEDLEACFKPPYGSFLDDELSIKYAKNYYDSTIIKTAMRKVRNEKRSLIRRKNDE